MPRYATKKGASVPPCVAGAPYAWLGASPTRLSRGWAIAAAGSAAVQRWQPAELGPGRRREVSEGRPRRPRGGLAPSRLAGNRRCCCDATATRPRRDHDAPRQLAVTAAKAFPSLCRKSVARRSRHASLLCWRVDSQVYKTLSVERSLTSLKR
jgi:hypothetical protein